MVILRPLFQRSVRRLQNRAAFLLQGRALRRPNNGAGPDDLDRVWQAECVEMAAILDRKDPDRSRKD